MTNYTELKRLAEAATVGPWIAGNDDDSDYYLVGPVAFDRVVTHPVVKLHNERNADYIAAASPDVVLRLIAVIDKLRTQNQALVKEMRHIAGISNGQVKRVADQALAAQAEGGV